MIRPSTQNSTPRAIGTGLISRAWAEIYNTNLLPDLNIFLFISSDLWTASVELSPGDHLYRFVAFGYAYIMYHLLICLKGQ
jgi:hypothetical protein